MDAGGGSWAILNIVGPLLLVLVLGWAFMRNRKARGTIDRTERATHDLYDAEEAKRRQDDARSHDHKA
jgi:cbb3-type cytochrome oxidase subunit 3